MDEAEYNKKKQELFDKYNIPEELHAALSYNAYENGHSSGYDEVYFFLTDLVYGLEVPIKNLIERIKIESTPIS